MTPEQLLSLKEELARTVQVVVNGKIDNLTKEVAHIHSRLNQQDVAMAPAIETINALGSGRKFILWVRPYFISIAAVGAVITWFKAN